MALANNIKRYRKAQGISQERMAERLSMSQPTYQRLEKNEIACTNQLSRIADAMGTTPDVLLTYHLNQDTSTEPESVDPKVLLEQIKAEVNEQRLIISFQNQYIAYLRAVWNKYGGWDNSGSANEL